MGRREKAEGAAANQPRPIGEAIGRGMKPEAAAVYQLRLDGEAIGRRKKAEGAAANQPRPGTYNGLEHSEFEPKDQKKGKMKRMKDAGPYTDADIEKQLTEKGTYNGLEHSEFEPNDQKKGKMKRMKDAGPYTDADPEKQLTEKTSNAMGLSLDGTPEEAQRNYRKYLKKVRRYCYSRGIRENAKSVFGRRKMVYTTPEHGTQYVDVTHESYFVTFVIQAKRGWLRGYIIGDQVYELEPDSEEQLYMPCPKHRKLPFKGNHHSISGGDPGGLTIGIHKLRKALKSIVENASNPDPETIGIFALYLCEGPKLPPVGNILCESIVSSAVSSLDKDFPKINDMIRSWSRVSKVIMMWLDCLASGEQLPPLNNKHNVPEMDSIYKYLANVRILHIDAYYGIKLFRHTKLEGEDIWEERDSYEGKAVRIPGIYARKEIMNGNKNTNKGKGGGMTVPKCRAAPDTEQRLRSHQNRLPSQKPQLRPYDFVHKRKLSTEVSYDKFGYEECHTKSLNEIDLLNDTKIVKQPQWLPPSQLSLVQSRMQVAVQAFGRFISDKMKSSEMINCAKNMHRSGVCLSLLTTQKLSRSSWVDSNMPIAMRPIRSCISKGKITGAGRIALQFKSKTGDTSQRVPYKMTNQLVQQSQGHPPSQPGWGMNNMPLTMEPFGNFITRMKSNQIINQAKIMHPNGLSLSLSTQNPSQTKCVHSNKPMVTHLIRNSSSTGKMAGGTRITQQMKGKVQVVSYKMANQAKIGCAPGWPRLPLLLTECNTKTGVTACRLFLGILRYRAR